MFKDTLDEPVALFCASFLPAATGPSGALLCFFRKSMSSAMSSSPMRTFGMRTCLYFSNRALTVGSHFPVKSSASYPKQFHTLRLPNPASLIKSNDPLKSGAIAQLGERIVRNDEVVGSIPTSSTKISSVKSCVCEVESSFSSPPLDSFVTWFVT
jgi:hypothetical protein